MKEGQRMKKFSTTKEDLQKKKSSRNEGLQQVYKSRYAKKCLQKGLQKNLYERRSTKRRSIKCPQKTVYKKKYMKEILQVIRKKFYYIIVVLC